MMFTGILLTGPAMATAPDIHALPPQEFLRAHAPLLERFHSASGAERWGISCDEFAACLHRSALHRFGGSLPVASVLNDYFAALHLNDLALCCALRKGSSAAWEEFVATYRPILYGAARSIVGSAGEARARELADSLYAELYGLNRSGDPGKGTSNNVRRPLLDYFHGRSKLSTWLHTVLAQRHVDAMRAGSRSTSLENDAPSPLRQAAAVAPENDPDRSRLLPHLRHAVAAALNALSASDRLLLALYYLQEMTLAQIARAQGVHEATISRQLARLRRDLRQSVERALHSPIGLDGLPAPKLSVAEVELCFTYALEDGGLDLDRALQTEPLPEET
jgi:RNA polymerase sigma factor (sigma-70 family)